VHLAESLYFTSANKEKYMHNIKANFDKIVVIVKQFLKSEITLHENIPRVGSKPKFSDVSVISLALVSEAMGIDSENNLFQKINSTYKNDFPSIIDRSGFNVRRRKLKHYIDKVREGIVAELDAFENVFSLDSMPVEVCKIARSSRCKLGKDEFETAPDKGYCASQQTYYYGYKLHCVCSYRGIIHSYDLTKGSVHDIAYLKELKQQFNDCLMLGDKGYISSEIKLDLFTSCNIKLETPMRGNQIGYKKQPYLFRKTRKRIETVYSQLCDQFMIRRNYAKSTTGLFTRIITKITAMAVLQYINASKNKPIGRIKNALT
jgi:Transposase DDE domain